MFTRTTWICGLLIGVITGMIGEGTVTAQTFLNPGTPYRSEADSPFASLINAGDVTLENFEGGLNAPGVTSTTGGFVINGNGVGQIDSVDGDDGSIDNANTGGTSFFSGFPNGTSVFTFEFDETVLGGLPTHAGVAWTDVGFNDDAVFGVGEVTFEAFDGNNDSLGTTGPTQVGDGAVTGGIDEDRFLGVIYSGGISRIAISMDANDWEIDHLQYGTPEPASATIFLIAGLSLLRLRPRRCA